MSDPDQSALPEPAAEPLPPPVAHRRARRTWPQRFVLGFNVLAALACFGTAFGLYYANERVGDRKVVTIEHAPEPGELSTAPGSVPVTDDTATDEPAVDVAAANFLITGADNGDCVEPGDLPDADVGDRTGLGERSDTIMVIRVDPAANQAAVLSFPRDLWVRIGGGSRKSRINSAFDRNDPSRLVQTIESEFAIPIDHYINVDFCAFKEIVGAVGGVRVPFPYAVRDKATGLSIPQAGCYPLGPDEALDYVRSRKYEYLDPATGTWKQDPTSDFGRIARQQDFIRRALQKALDKGARDPRVANQLLNAGLKYVITDDGLTIGSLLDFARAMKNLDPATIHTYTVESERAIISSNDVLLPRLETDNMEAILAVFRGQARLADAPEQTATTPITTTSTSSTTTTVASTRTTVGAPGSSTPSTSSTTTSAPATTTTLPTVVAEENQQGIVPPPDLSCR
jgi:LCP family protein required for cell wall assembly